MMTEQADKTNSTSRLDFAEPMEFDTKENKNKGKRKRKVHKVSNIPSMEFHEDEGESEEP